jgi:hypothetical protein
MKSRTKPVLRAVPAAQVQLSFNVQGVLRDVQHAFYGLSMNPSRGCAGRYELLAELSGEAAQRALF